MRAARALSSVFSGSRGQERKAVQLTAVGWALRRIGQPMSAPFVHDGSGAFHGGAQD